MGKLCVSILLLMAANVGKPIAFSTVSVPRTWARGDQAGYLVVTSANWSKLYSSVPAGADFANCIYVVAALGTRPNPGYRVRITGIAQEGDRVEVTVEELHPDPGGIYPQMLVSPVAAAEVKRKDLQPYPEYRFSFVDRNGRQLAEVKTAF